MLEQQAIKKVYPENFPVPTPSKTEEELNEWKAAREARKLGLSEGEYQFYFNDGQLDEEWMTNMWYGFRRKGLGFDPDYAKPEDIEIRSLGHLVEEIPYGEYFSQSAGYKAMLSRPEDDPKRQKVLDFQADVVLRSLSADLQEKIAKAPGLQEKIRDLVKTNIQKNAFFLRDQARIQEGKDEDVSKQWKEIIDKYSSLEKEIYEIAEKEKIN